MNKYEFIKIDESILKWRWYHNDNAFRVFFHLVLKANVCDQDFEAITVRRGQVVTSLKILSEELGMGIQSVRTALKHLESTGEVTRSSCAKYSVITIPNYDMYQNSPGGQNDE